LEKVIVALDCGTSGCRAMAFSIQGVCLYKSYRELPRYYPAPGWVEQEALELWALLKSCLQEVLVWAGPDNVLTLGITNQRETVIAWDKNSGVPLSPALVWQCRRTAPFCLQNKGFSPYLFAKTGLFLDPYFSASKMLWLLNQKNQLSEKIKRGSLCLGTVDTWILYMITAGKLFATDPTNASRTLLYNIRLKNWDPELCNLFDIPINALAQIKPSIGEWGFTDPSQTGKALPIGAVLGDQQAAFFAQGQGTRSFIKCTYGTGLFLMGEGSLTHHPAPQILPDFILNKSSLNYLTANNSQAGGSEVSADPLLAKVQAPSIIGSGLIPKTSANETVKVALAKKPVLPLSHLSQNLSENTQDDAPKNQPVLLTTVAWADEMNFAYAFEGALFNGGSCIQWMRDALGLIKDAGQSEIDALSLPHSGSVYFIPALTGLGAPIWDASARGAWMGLSPSSSRAHLVRSVLESLAYQVAQVVGVWGRPVEELRADGGATQNAFLMQWQADVLGLPVCVTREKEATALGVAAAAAVSAGLIDRQTLFTWNPVVKEYWPGTHTSLAQTEFEVWKKVEQRCLNWNFSA